MIKLDESWLYSKGNYYLVEHWQEDGKNIYGKGKYPDRESFLKGCSKHLTEQHIKDIDDGKNVTIPQEDGTTLFFKHCNF